ncbi:hypothetical protein AWENTII_008715 [Aspergillus wentii]
MLAINCFAAACSRLFRRGNRRAGRASEQALSCRSGCCSGGRQARTHFMVYGDAANRVDLRRVEPCLTIFAHPIELGPRSIYDDESAHSPNGPERHPPVEEPRRRSTFVRPFVSVPLSPIPEESEEPAPDSKPSWEPAVPPPILGESEVTSSVESPLGGMKPWSGSPLAPCDTEEEPQKSVEEPRCAPVEAPIAKATYKPKSKRLTRRKVNRKRGRSSPSDEEQPGPETPTNKRRNLGPPGSTPFARRLTPLSRRLSTNAAPYSERLRRRAVERQGRIHRTVFRLPQLIAQTEADRQASETPPLSPCPEFPHTSFDFRAERTEQENQPSTDESESQQPSTPETPQQRGWNIRGLLNSVPRSFSRLIPTFGRSSRSSEASAVPQPSSERVARTAPPQSDSTTSGSGVRSHRRRSDQPSGKVDLSYSLFPARIDRNLYLPPPQEPEAPRSRPLDSEKPSASQEAQPKLQHAVTSDTLETADKGDEVSSQTPSDAQKKRKRSSSPDVIPNPAGSSYGLDLDYFCYSSDSEEETETEAQESESFMKSSTLAKSAVRSALRSERPSKKVRFDSSPEDTPSKRRFLARATDPYNGRHFIGMGDAARSSEATTSASTTTGPATPTPPTRVSQPPQRSPGFTPNKQGTFALDYDDFSDDSESNVPPSPASALSPSTAPEQRTPARAETQESVQSPRPTPRQAPLPSTPAKVDKEALAKVRSQAEKYKPKTPSGLRTTSRYSSPMVAAPDAVTEKEPVEKFGEDQFAQDAQWLYDNCPSGDLRQLAWPAKQSLKESLGVSTEAVRILDDIWDDSEVDGAYNVFRQSLEEFGQTLA